MKSQKLVVALAFASVFAVSSASALTINTLGDANYRGNYDSAALALRQVGGQDLIPATGTVPLIKPGYVTVNVPSQNNYYICATLGNNAMQNYTDNSSNCIGPYTLDPNQNNISISMTSFLSQESAHK